VLESDDGDDRQACRSGARERFKAGDFGGLRACDACGNRLLWRRPVRQRGPSCRSVTGWRRPPIVEPLEWSAAERTKADKSR